MEAIDPHGGRQVDRAQWYLAHVRRAHDERQAGVDARERPLARAPTTEHRAQCANGPATQVVAAGVGCACVL